ncbi:MAG: carbohydrate-binding protein [Armatimonadetes bacterium]|nr:carbohydrate-binding protein [Armatimonadota bacterium]
MKTSILAFVVLITSFAHAYEYRYVEGEKHTRTEGSGLREEGFTSWMAHPSQGAVMVLAEGGWLDYTVEGLADAEYHVFLRGLAWASGCEVDVSWDGQLVGRTKYAKPGTALKWSNEIGVVRGPGTHTLRLAAAPGIIQAPYIDVVLLTTQAGLRPEDDDRDFASFATPFPFLRLGERTIPPNPPTQPIPDLGVEVLRLEADPFVIGANPLRVALKAREATDLTLRSRLADGLQMQAPLRLPPNEEASAEFACEALQAGRVDLTLSVAKPDGATASASYPVTIPQPLAVSLDEYAYPTTAERAVWHATFSASETIAQQTSAELTLVRFGSGALLQSYTLAGALPGIEQPFPLTGLARGRYEVRSRFLRQGVEMARDTRTFIIHEPYALDPWEPVQRTERRGDTILLNGKPFLGRLLYHAAANADVRDHGFSLLQCSGGDPDPLPSIGQHLDACAQNQLYGTVALFNNRYFLPGDHFDLDRIREAVLRYKDHPATWAWDLIDEPEVSVSPERVLEAARLIRELDPNHIVWVNLCQVDKGLDYLESQDLWSFDRYPIPSQGLAGYLDWLAVSDEHLRGRRPVGTVLQTYQTGSPNLRLPTPDELRSSAYLHIIHGYKWFGYYSYYDGEPAECLARNPLLWSYTRALNGELSTLSPLILADAPYAPVASDQPPTSFQAALKEHAGRRYLIAVNLGPQPLRATMTLTGSTADLLFEEERALPLKDGALTDDFLPSATHIYLVR